MIGLLVKVVSRLIALVSSAAILGLAVPAHAQSTIKNPGDRVRYFFEAEPHALLGALDPPGVGNDAGLGLGFRGTLNILPSGFIAPINDAVGIGFGIDWVHYDNETGGRGHCERFVPGPAGTQVCVDVSGSGPTSNYFFLPVVLQWNFFLTPIISVFGEPGFGIVHDTWDADPCPLAGGCDASDTDPILYFEGGARFLFGDTVGLTVRIGYPMLTVGVSILL